MGVIIPLVAKIPFAPVFEFGLEFALLSKTETSNARASSPPPYMILGRGIESHGVSLRLLAHKTISGLAVSIDTNNKLFLCSSVKFSRYVVTCSSPSQLPVIKPKFSSVEFIAEVIDKRARPTTQTHLQD